jgi:hypothetical protein
MAARMTVDPHGRLSATRQSIASKSGPKKASSPAPCAVSTAPANKDMAHNDCIQDQKTSEWLTQGAGNSGPLFRLALLCCAFVDLEKYDE